jgi:hypothetical protein
VAATRALTTILEILGQAHEEYDQQVREIINGLADEDLVDLIVLCDREIHDFSEFRLEIKHRAEAELKNRGTP